MKRDWTESRCSAGDSLLSAMKTLAESRTGIVLIVDDQRRLLGTLVDGDIRRAVLSGGRLEDPIGRAMNRSPITAKTDQPLQSYLDLMVQHVVQQLPIVDDENKVVDLILAHDVDSVLATGPKAVIMAGGLGTRLRPLTDDLPKPLLPVGERPIMDHILSQLQDGGIREVVVSTHYKGEMIQEHFGDGSAMGLDIQYVSESERYGTIGSLRLMRDQLKEPFVVINGDILTKLDFSAMASFHYQHRADMTVGIRQYDFDVPYGVTHVQDGWVRGLEEKPKVSLFINAGVYLINPDVIDYIPEGKPMDATDLISELVAENRRVAAFPVLEYWLDIGQTRDYERANTDLESGGSDNA